MSHDELMTKKELCLKAADECASIKMWDMWVRKANDLRNKAMREIEENQGRSIFTIPLYGKKKKKRNFNYSYDNCELEQFSIAINNLKKELFGKYRINNKGFVRYNKLHILMVVVEKWLERR